MSEQEKHDAEKLVAAVEVLSPEQKSYILGYAEGLADALMDPHFAGAVRDVLDDCRTE